MKIKITTLLFAVCLCLSTAAFAVDEPNNLGPAADPPAGSSMTIVTSGNGATVTVRGMDIYNDNLYVYGGDHIEIVKFVGGVAKIPAKHWLNTIFKGTDNLWHYLLVAPENQVMPKEWMRDGVCVMPDFGHGSSITACEWLRGYKEAQASQPPKGKK